MVGSGIFVMHLKEVKVVLREVFFIVKVKLVGVIAKHAHHAVVAFPLGLYHHFFQGLLHCYVVLMALIVMHNDFFRLSMAARYL